MLVLRAQAVLWWQLLGPGPIFALCHPGQLSDQFAQAAPRLLPSQVCPGLRFNQLASILSSSVTTGHCWSRQSRARVVPG